MKTNRKYSFKDVDMLLASKTIVKSLSDYLPELSLVRSNWTDNYTSQLGSSIDDAMDNFWGLDKKKELREASARLSAIQIPAMRDLSFLKAQIEVDFKDKPERRNAILKSLGLSNLKAVHSGSQEAIIQQLFTFKKGMNVELMAEITEKGTNQALLVRIITYANELTEAEISQETLKERSKLISKEAVIAFNEIYSEMMGICKIASNFYKYEPLKKAQFTFSKVVANMNASKSTLPNNTIEDNEAA